MRLFIGITSSRDWKPEFGVSLCGLVNKLTMDCAEGKMESLWMKSNMGNALLPKGRQGLLDEALAGNYTHALFIDDDMQFPASALDSLVSRDLPVVAVNGCKKKFPIEGSAADMDGNQLSSEGKTGTQEVLYAGLGMMLIRLEDVRHVPAPHFEIIWDDKQKAYLGEDYYFSYTLRGHGVKIHVDHDASNMIKHVGNFGFGFARAG